MNQVSNHFNLFFDASSFIKRSFYAASKDSESNIFKIFDRAISYFKPKSVFVVWNAGVSSAKRRIHSQYKTFTRRMDKEDETAFEEYCRYSQDIFKHMPLRQLSLCNLDSIDVTAFLWDKLQQTKVVVSNHQDLFQLLDKKTLLYRPISEEIIDHGSAERLLGFPLKHYLLWKSMVGSTRDCVPGITGIGKKKAKAIINAVINSGKKLPINPHELQIIERNKLIFCPGALLSQDDKVAIINACVQESAKEICKSVKASIIFSHEFSTNYPNINHFVTERCNSILGRTS